MANSHDAAAKLVARKLRGEYDPKWNVELLLAVINHQRHGDDAYWHLSIVLAMCVSHEGSGDDLYFAEDVVYHVWRAASKQPHDNDHKTKAASKTQKGGEKHCQ